MRNVVASPTSLPKLEGTKREKFMNIGLWILQVLLAVAFFAHGGFFLFPPADMVGMLNASIPPALRLLIGVAEVLAALGLILPGLTRIQPWLTALAVVGPMFVMPSVTVLHLWRGEISSAISAAILLALVTFVAYMRWKVKPILPRTVVSYSLG